MLFIIFGTRVSHHQVGEGQFFCPKCQAPRAYKHKRATRYFTLYFVPLIPLGKLGEFVECQTCGVAFETAVLQMRGPVPKRQPAAPSRAALPQLINALPEKLKSGTPVEYLVRDLTAAGVDRDAALTMIKPHLGEAQKNCPTCGLTYIAEITNCSECGKAL